MLKNGWNLVQRIQVRMLSQNKNWALAEGYLKKLESRFSNQFSPKPKWHSNQSVELILQESNVVIAKNSGS